MSKTIIIGAAGAVGKRLCTALARAGGEVIACDRMEFIPSTIRFMASKSIGGVDVRDQEALNKVFAEHGDEHTTVWNLASPLVREPPWELPPPSSSPLYEAYEACLGLGLG